MLIKSIILNTNFFIKKTLLLFLALMLLTASYAQKMGKNLVPNPSFEKHKNKSSVIKNAIPWQGEGTVDFYLKQEKLDTSKYKGAHTGTCYAGLRFQPNYKEYMYVKLTSTLEKGKTYFFKMHVRFKTSSSVTVKQLGVYFSDDKFKVDMSFEKEGIIDSTFIEGLSGLNNWIPIQGEYIANGREKYIIVGNFKTKMKEDFVRLKKWDIFKMREAYYYIDDITLRKKIIQNDSSITKLNNEETETYIFPDTFKTGQIVEIKNLQFKNGTAVLIKPSFKILDELVNKLNEHPFMEIQINGHTDNNEIEVKNKKLSKARAKIIYKYLLSQSVINPMNYNGYGSKKPIAPNDTDENKEKNRRIEMVIIKEE